MTLREQLERDEGFVGHAYQDSRGYWTIGIGRCVDARVGGGLSRPEADMLLDNDIYAKSAELLGRAPWVRFLDEPRRAALVNMAFNLGVPGLMGFRNALASMQRGDWAAARRHLLDSKWAGQVGERAERLADQILTGEWH